ncbi:uncharacterized protein LOC131285236 [Anopheles ziemanni]|uniref:uncharacterized protein LOC131265017 n=1 Tax=Anopheles coustani TaxID=139045 RepID=UPI0026592129|nr:uncharacterized protein LOC131265017 [Anopheles coustani]XP_058170074.1 uncharacterized protein LOC131285236 [Anopheles ziemanni]
MAKEESKYGFKDKAKAEESLELLKAEDHKYQMLTVRGLIGRAKRVLTLTKAEEKVNNIKAAIETFEKWLEANSTSSTKNSKPKEAEEKVETVPGLGFKDKQAAEQTLKILEGRDPDYQKLAIKGLLGSAKRVLPATKNEDKVKSIKEAMAMFEDFLDLFDREERGKQNMAYLSIELIRQLPTPSKPDKLAADFLDCYESVAKGNYKHLRTKTPKDGQETWDIIRNRNLQKLKPKGDEKLFDSDGKPTETHLKLVQWAYSPQVEKLKTYAATHAQSKSNPRKRTHSTSDGEDCSKSKDKHDKDRSNKKSKK